jgi:O-antigen ligase
MVINKFFMVLVLLCLLLLTTLLLVAQGAFGPSDLWGSGRVTGAIELLVLLFLLLNLHRLQRPTLTMVIVFLWILWTFWRAQFAEANDMYLWLSGDVFPVLLWPSVYLFFCTYSRYDSQSPRLFVPYFVFMALACSFMFFLVFQFFNAGRLNRAMQLNAVYYPLLTIPWLPLVKKPLLRYIVFAVVAVAVFYSVKRAALAVLVIAGFVYVLVEYFLLTKRLRLANIIVPAVLLSMALVGFSYVDESLGGLFSKRLEATSVDGGSGRLELYSSVLDELHRSSDESLIFGHGYGSSPRYFGTTSHNDFLEMLFAYGLIGLVLYILLHVSLLTKTIRLIRSKSPYASALAVSYAVFLVASMVSHLIIYPTYFVYIVALWGTIEGLEQRDSPSGSRIVPPRRFNGAGKGIAPHTYAPKQNQS